MSKTDKSNNESSDKGQQYSGFSKKWQKFLSTDWQKSAESFSTDELKKKIVLWEQAISSSEKDMDADHKLNGLKEKATELKEEIKEHSKVYTESINGSHAMIRFAVYLLESRGTPVK